jgi:hypothetical protein
MMSKGPHCSAQDQVVHNHCVPCSGSCGGAMVHHLILELEVS